MLGLSCRLLGCAKIADETAKFVGECHGLSFQILEDLWFEIAQLRCDVKLSSHFGDRAFGVVQELDELLGFLLNVGTSGFLLNVER